MTDKEYIENIDKVDTDTLFENLEYYGFDSYYRDLWYATIEELKKRIEIRPQGEWIRTGSLGNGNAQYECSICHYGDEQAESQEVPYCWHCGASMQKGGAK